MSSRALFERACQVMPGGVSSAHARGGDNGKSVAKDCRACHEPWRGVTDQRCMSCHTRAPHAATEARTPPCMSCHPEHRDAPKLALMDDAKCVGCHADLQAHVKAGVRVRDANQARQTVSRPGMAKATRLASESPTDGWVAMARQPQ